MSRDALASLGIWVGVIIGSLTVVDWLLLDEHKMWLKRKLEDVWLWLAEWRLAALLRIFRAHYFQWAIGGFSLLWLAMSMYSVIRYGLNASGGFASTFQSPLRLYPFQVWMDLVALPVATIVVAFTFYPRFADWLTSAATISQYLKRVLSALVLMLLCAFGFSFIVWLVIGFHSPFPTAIPHDQLVAFYEVRWGGKPGAILVHALATLVASPLVAAMFLIFAVWLLSFGWLAVASAIMVLIWTSQFILFRVVASPKGPVLGVSGLLIGLGAILKAFNL